MGPLVAWRLAEAAWQQARTGIAPMLLADDVLGELDPARRAGFWRAVGTTAFSTACAYAIAVTAGVLLGELAQLGDLVVVDLVERDQQPSLVLGQQIGDQLDLAAERRLGSVPLRRAPRHASRTHRPRDTRQTAANSLRVEAFEQPRQLLTCDSIDEAGGGGLAHDEPAELPRAIFDRVQHHRLPRAARARIDRRPGSRAPTVLQTLHKLLDQPIAAHEHGRADTEAWLERVRRHGSSIAFF